jgi:hypothetical protein
MKYTVITYMRRHTLLDDHLNSYNYPRNFPTNTSITTTEHWLLPKVLTLIIPNYVTYLYNFKQFWKCGAGVALRNKDLWVKKLRKMNL